MDAHAGFPQSTSPSGNSEYLLRLLLDGIDDYAIYLLDTSGHVTTWNTGAMRLKGYNADEILGQSFARFFEPEDQAWGLPQILLERAAAAGKTEVEGWRVRKNGARFWAHVTITALRDERGNLTGFAKVTRDGTERHHFEERIRRLNRLYVVLSEISEGIVPIRDLRRLAAELEQRVADRTAELEARNKELETFTYSVSCDLKAPLRGIEGYSRILLEDYAERLDDEGRRFLANIHRATTRMNQIIEDLLAYSRLERRALQNSPINIDALIATLLEERAAEIEQRQAQVAVDTVAVPIYADPEGLGLALRNLLDNALKFSQSVGRAVITIGARRLPTAVRLWVQDNGIGFEMKYHDRIFDIFQRLHRADEYPGTGIGLAIVRRAMERMGGRAWAESEPGAGATFYLEIPQPGAAG